MKHFFILAFLLLATIASYGQKLDYNAFQARNTFFLEFGGKAWAWSLNYERRFILNEKVRIGAQLGVSKAMSGMNVDPDPSGTLYFPLSINGMFGRSEHQFEGGLGVTIKTSDGFHMGKYSYPTLEGKARMMGTMQAGYRYHPHIGGVVFRLNYTGIYQYLNGHPTTGSPLNHWFGIAIGWSLPNANVN